MDEFYKYTKKFGKKIWERDDSRMTPKVIFSVTRMECPWRTGMPFTKREIQNIQTEEQC